MRLDTASLCRHSESLACCAIQLSLTEQAYECLIEQACLSAAGVAAAAHAAVHVVAVQRVKAHAAARRRQIAHLPDQAIHRLLCEQHTPVNTMAAPLL